MKNNRIAFLCLALIICVITVLMASVLFTEKPSLPAEPAELATVQTTQAPTEPTIALTDVPVLFNNLFCYEFDSIESIDMFICDTDIAIDQLIAECSTIDVYTTEALAVMLEEIDRLCAEQTNAVRQKEWLLLWAEKEEEYSYATRTWKYLKNLGYSDIACAGILGNLMAECGGHTLKLNPFLYDKATGNYYGMFQWSTFYYPAITGAGFEEQLDYYAQTSTQVFNIWGKNYAEGFTLDDFNELSDPRDAALAFAMVYERCASWTYERRQNFAEVAYQYFVLDFEEIFYE